MSFDGVTGSKSFLCLTSLFQSQIDTDILLNLVSGGSRQFKGGCCTSIVQSLTGLVTFWYATALTSISTANGTPRHQRSWTFLSSTGASKSRTAQCCRNASSPRECPATTTQARRWCTGSKSKCKHQFRR